MKKGVIASVGLLVIIFYINGCGIINRGADPNLENDPSAFDAHKHQQIDSNLSGYGNVDKSEQEANITEQMILELIKINTVDEVRIITYQNEFLIAVDNEADDRKALKTVIINYLNTNFPTKKVRVVTDPETVNQIFFLDEGFQSDGLSEEYGIQLKEFFYVEVDENVDGQFR
ncbi:YhcN/YlaJ family sporulation lipoprotein [Bacillaceae bacterium IKA-2]|nr:YhcN/YlaJ family sporulation lipoprotein [Bacillaceae bacterium IKA-2]